MARKNKKALTAKEKRNQFYGAIFAIISALGFAMLGILAKLIYQEPVSVKAVLMLRMIASTALIWVYIFFMGKELKKGKRIKPHMYAIIGFFGFYLSAVAGLNALLYISVGLSVILYNTFPVMVILIMAVIEKKLPSRSNILALIVVQIGTFLVLGDGLKTSPDMLRGVIFALVSALSGAIYIVLNHKYSATANSMLLIAHGLLYSTVFSIAHFIFTSPFSDIIMSARSYFLIMISSAVFTLSYIFFGHSIKMLGASRASLINAISPIFAVLMAFLVLGEVLSTKQILGGVIIFSTILLLKKRDVVILRKKKVTEV